jgi:hypothetical protein
MLDNTEGLNAFLELSKIYSIGPKNLDVGGDPFQNRIIEDIFDISNTIYNPLCKKYSILPNKKYDTITSFSVLNILVIKDENDNYIFDSETAKHHIGLCICYLENEGALYIKVYEGDKTNKEGGKNEIYLQTNYEWSQYYYFLYDICNANNCILYMDMSNKLYIIKKM